MPYTNRDQVATKATPQGTLTYVYDVSGNVASVVSSNANGTNVSYAWDANNRLQTVTDNRTSGATAYAYDATNQLQSFTYPNGITHSYGYDNRDRNTNLTAGGVTYTQAFSFSGRKQSVSESTGRNVGYSYDNIYRLLNENITGAPSNGSLNYTLDGVGNRLALTSTLAALQSQTASYDPDDRISGDTFDSNGNTLTSNGVTYSYEFEDRLVSTNTGVQVTYDGDGNRVSETAGGVTTKFLVDEFNPTHYAQVAEEIVSGAVTAQYTDGLIRVSQRRSGTVSYYGYDGGESVRQLFDNAGAVTDTYAYDAFGNTVARTGSTVNPFLYRGEQFDTSLQMYYLRARYYVLKTGRFLTQDKYPGQELEACNCHDGDRALPPVGAHHWFGYAKSDPVNRIDPSGKDDVIEVALIEAKEVKKAADLGGAAACGVSLGLLGAQLIFSDTTLREGFFSRGAGNTYIGCGLSMMGGLNASFLTFAGAATCASSIAEFTMELDEYLRNPEEVAFKQTLSAFDTAFGCAAWAATELLAE